MSINFVSTAIVTSDNGIDYNTEVAVENEASRNARLARESAGQKPLYEQLREQQMRKQEEYDNNTKLMRAPTRAMDEDDVAFFEELEERKNKIKELRNTSEEQQLANFRSAQRNKELAAIQQQHNLKAVDTLEETLSSTNLPPPIASSTSSVSAPSLTLPIVTIKRKSADKGSDSKAGKRVKESNDNSNNNNSNSSNNNSNNSNKNSNDNDNNENNNSEGKSDTYTEQKEAEAKKSPASSTQKGALALLGGYSSDENEESDS